MAVRAEGVLLQLDTVTEVETPEHIRFRYQLAGPVRRAFAYLIDLLVKGAVAVAFFMAVGVSGALGFDGFSQAAIFILLFMLEWGYYVLFESIWNGSSPGKRAANLRVVKEGGYPITFMDSVLRNLLRAADFLPSAYALGVVTMMTDRRFRRLGDRVAGTMVVVDERRHAAKPVLINPAPTKDELEGLPRPRLSGAELEAIELFLRRKDTLSPARELELAEMVAPLFSSRLGIPHRNPSRWLALLYERATSREAVLPPSMRRPELRR